MRLAEELVQLYEQAIHHLLCTSVGKVAYRYKLGGFWPGVLPDSTHRRAAQMYVHVIIYGMEVY
jgi:hypothetical protein